MVLTVHLIDNNWEMRGTTLDFIRFKTPYKGEAASGLLLGTIMYWGLEKEVKSITTDFAADIFKGVEILRKELYDTGHSKKHSPRANFQVRSNAHVLNPTVKPS